MKNAAKRPTKTPEIAHAFKLRPRVGVHMGDVAGGTPESVHLGVPPGGRSLVTFMNRIGWASIVPGPASRVPKKEVRRRKEKMDRRERILTTDSISFESVPVVLNLDSVVSTLPKKKTHNPL